MNAPNQVWDPGLQNERNRLAWQRTALSGLACCLVVARLLADTSLPIALVLALSAVISTGFLTWESIRRYRRTHDALFAGHAIGNGLPNLLITALVAITGIAALLYVLQLD